MSSFEGTTLPELHGAAAARRARRSGAVLFGPNVSTPPARRRLTAAIQRAAGGDALVMTDQEGGDVRQIPFADTAEELAADRREREPRAGRRRRAARLGDGRARVRRPTCPENVVAASRELLDAGVMPTVKHFPGFGRATENTDDAPVTIDASRAELETDLEPFRAAIDADVPLVMASHALYPALDADTSRRSRPRSSTTFSGASSGSMAS